jgi:hypothetical protein
MQLTFKLKAIADGFLCLIGIADSSLSGRTALDFCDTRQIDLSAQVTHGPRSIDLMLPINAFFAGCSDRLRVRRAASVARVLRVPLVDGGCAAR